MKPIFPGVEYYILTHDEIKIGFMGLIELDWLVSQSTVKPEYYVYKDFIECGKKLVEFFQKEKCDLIIALTHMRNYNDV